jgi:hypothetical protein
MLASLLELANVHVALGNLNEALRLLAVVLNHPASAQISLNTNRSETLRDAAEKLRAKVEAQLDHFLYRSAWESGQRQRLADVVSHLMS